MLRSGFNWVSKAVGISLDKYFPMCLIFLCGYGGYVAPCLLSTRVATATGYTSKVFRCFRGSEYVMRIKEYDVLADKLGLPGILKPINPLHHRKDQMTALRRRSRGMM